MSGHEINPPEYYDDAEQVECPYCRYIMQLADHGNKRSGHWWVHYICRKCGHQIKEDNF